MCSKILAKTSISFLVLKTRLQIETAWYLTGTGIYLHASSTVLALGATWVVYRQYSSLFRASFCHLYIRVAIAFWL
jgi:hypothetical protein